MRPNLALLSLSILISSVTDYAQAAKTCQPCHGPCAAAVRPGTSFNQNQDTAADCIAFLSGSGSIPEYVTGKCRSEHKYSSACSCLARTESTTSLATTVSPTSSVLTTPGISSTPDTSPSVSGTTSPLQSTPLPSTERTTPSTLPTTPVTSTPAYSGTATVSSELATTPSSESSTPSESSTTPSETSSGSTTTPEPTSTPGSTSSPGSASLPESTSTPESTTTPESTSAPESTSTPESTTKAQSTTAPESTASSTPTSTPESTSIPQSTTVPESTSTAHESTTSSTSTLATVPTGFPRIIATDVIGGASRELKLVKQTTTFYLTYAATATQYAPANGVPYFLDPVTGRLSITLSPGLTGDVQTYFFTYNTPLPNGSGYIGQWMLASDIAANANKRYVRCTRNTSGQLTCLSEADSALLFLRTATAFNVYIGNPPAAGNSVALTLSLPLA